MKRLRNFALVMLILLAFMRPDVLVGLIASTGGGLLVIYVLWHVAKTLLVGMLPGKR
jgi:hypothetical protein